MNQRAPILLTGALIVIVIIALLLARPEVSWVKTFHYKSKAPYGTGFIYTLLEQKYGKDNVKTSDQPFDLTHLKLDDNITYDYIKIGRNRKSNDAETAALLSFVSKGNNALMVLEDFDFSVLDSIIQDECYVWKSFVSDEENELETEVEDLFQEIPADQDLQNILDSLDQTYLDTIETTDEWDEESSDTDSVGYWANKMVAETFDSTIGLNFTDVEFCREDSGYYFVNVVRLDTFFYRWQHFEMDCLNSLDSLRIRVLGEADSNKVTFFEIPLGKGHLYIHSIPLAFTNVALLDENRLEYAEKTMSYLDGKKLIWDIYRNNNFDRGHPSDLNSSSTPLSYLLTEPALKWTIYLIFFSAILFVFFRAKRRQQYIPVIEPNVNTSIEYIEMMGQLYFEEKDHQFIAHQMWKRFLDYIRTHYYIVPKEGDISWIKRVSEKSLVSELKIIGIVRAYEKTKLTKVSEDELINFYDKLNYFYSNCN
ncbi:MAG: hypothetical protein R2730_15480 [Chitinophagales bacterium]